MKRSLLLGVIASFFLAFYSSFTFASSEKGAESIILKGGKMGDVVFPHGRHQGVTVDCQPCHALFPKEPGIVEKMKTDEKLKKRDVMNMCKGCHQEIKSKGEKAGPTTCKGCHHK